ncbi:hypothetical protein BJ968_004756 [Kineococcus aurantiacus]|uniref:Uncharacterized protein n=1 Tax=Kineococcus aurantiacus TaxID=37633 RepID=A0A7Y9J3A2_9ACTN|nr:hypothetical protein [Kineococcus aurantiacus]
MVADKSVKNPATVDPTEGAKDPDVRYVQQNLSAT